MRCKFVTGWIKPPRGVLRHRNAMLAFQSTGRATRGSNVSTRSSNASPRLISFSSSDMRPLGPVLRVDGNVFVGQIAGPHGGRRGAAVEHDADGELAFFHDALSLFLAVTGGTSSLPCDPHLVEEHFDMIDVEVAHA